jgi:hypothetical protein
MMQFLVHARVSAMAQASAWLRFRHKSRDKLRRAAIAAAARWPGGHESGGGAGRDAGQDGGDMGLKIHH